ncbi:exodeoxyribonuclease III [Maritalea porphyrae]|jgi:exodeoxyribonuclease-3|uniref:exodeoxyribonuclease III n=1 Tax=Maritalea porphyrae TaxID=880732 RepID=UPI0022AED3EF|nr:exodeoxyribonuclease III [Maritalea porphyrae]MCZ4272270.1 exodeoxyribonuclease III [Maritalea porphyrae]
MSISVATWNINSVRLRLPMVQDFLADHKPDVLCLQEIKCQNDQFPKKAFEESGYTYQAVNGQKSYHGVAIVSRIPMEDHNAREFCAMGDARHISGVVEAPFGKTRIHNFYIPAGGDEADVTINPKFKHKMDFLAELQDWFDHEDFDDGHVIVGDFNIAPHENDVWSHKKLLKVVSHTPIETELLDAIQARRNWVDVVRKHIPHDERLFSWWSYRSKDWSQSDKGRRLDHIWSTPDVAQHSTQTVVLRDARGWSEKPSDHVPIISHFG